MLKFQVWIKIIVSNGIGSTYWILMKNAVEDFDELRRSNNENMMI